MRFSSLLLSLVVAVTVGTSFTAAVVCQGKDQSACAAAAADGCGWIATLSGCYACSDASSSSICGMASNFCAWTGSKCVPLTTTTTTNAPTTTTTTTPAASGFSATCTANNKFSNYAVVYPKPQACTATSIVTCWNALLAAGTTAQTCTAVRTALDDYTACARTAIKASDVLADSNCQEWAGTATSILKETPTWELTTPSFQACAGLVCLDSLATATVKCSSENFVPVNSGALCPPWWTLTTTTTLTSTVTAMAFPEPSSDYLSGNMKVGWELADDVITFTVAATLDSSKFAAFAVAPNGVSQMMDGKGFACQIPSLGTTTTSCIAISTQLNSASQRFDDSTLAVLAAGADSTKGYIKMRLSASKMGITSGEQRIIFAMGPWNAGSLNYHGSMSTSRGSATAIFRQTTTTVTETPPAATCQGKDQPACAAAAAEGCGWIVTLNACYACSDASSSSICAMATEFCSWTGSSCVQKTTTTTEAAPTMPPPPAGGDSSSAMNSNMGGMSSMMNGMSSMMNGMSSMMGGMSSMMGGMSSMMNGMSSTMGGMSSMVNPKGSSSSSNAAPPSPAPTTQQVSCTGKSQTACTEAAASGCFWVALLNGCYACRDAPSESYCNQAGEVCEWVGTGCIQKTTTTTTTTTTPAPTTAAPEPTPPPPSPSPPSSPAPLSEAPPTTEAPASTAVPSTSSPSSSTPPPSPSPSPSPAPPTATSEEEEDISASGSGGAPSILPTSAEPTEPTPPPDSTSPPSQQGSDSTSSSSSSSSSSSDTATSPPDSSSASPTPSPPPNSGEATPPPTTTTPVPATTATPVPPVTTKRTAPPPIPPPTPKSTDEVLSDTPALTTTAAPGLDFTVTLRPMPSKSAVDAQAFVNLLAQIVGTSPGNIVLTAGESGSNNTQVVTVRFLQDRGRLQASFQNLTTTNKMKLGILTIRAAPSSTEAPQDNGGFLLIFVALGFLGAFLIIAFFAYRAFRKKMNEAKDDSSDMQRFRDAMVEEYGDSAEEMLGREYNNGSGHGLSHTDREAL